MFVLLFEKSFWETFSFYPPPALRIILKSSVSFHMQISSTSLMPVTGFMLTSLWSSSAPLSRLCSPSPLTDSLPRLTFFLFFSLLKKKQKKNNLYTHTVLCKNIKHSIDKKILNNEMSIEIITTLSSK